MTASKHGMVIWLMGPTSAGKTTLGASLLVQLREKGVPTIFYDGDEMRALIGESHGFSTADRMRTVSGLVHLANKAVDAGLLVIVAALTANEDARRYVHENIADVLVGYVHCPLEVCAERDPKGLYERARNGEIDTLIGYNVDYLPPHNPAIVLNTHQKSVKVLTAELEEILNTRMG
jgi:adenylylsulfate kinase